MRLEQYLSLKKLSEREFSSILNVSQAHVSNIIKGRRNPSLILAKRIEEATNGYVAIKDLLNPEVPSRLRNMEKNEDEKENSVMGG